MANESLESCDTFQVTVNNVAPSLTVVGNQTVDQGRLLKIIDLGTFSDPGFANSLNPIAGGEFEETFTFSIDWGDGTPPSSGPATVDQFGNAGASTIGSFDGIHVYASSGVFKVIISVSDDDGGSSTESFQVTVASSIFVLHPTACEALALRGNATISVPGSVVVNSICTSNALEATANARLSAASIDVVGGTRWTKNVTISPLPNTGVEPIFDPLLNLAAPLGGTLQNSANCTGKSTQTLNAGTYDQIKATGNCVLTLLPGVYVVKGGGFQISGNAQVSGAGVLIYNAGSNYPEPGGTFGSILLSGKSSVSLSPLGVVAAGSQPLAASVTLFQARDNPNVITISSNAAGIDGTIYAPSASVTVIGNAVLGASIIANQVAFSGNSASPLATEFASNAPNGIPGDSIQLNVPSAQIIPYHNRLRPTDVNHDNQVTSIDALIVINDLNERGARKLSDERSLNPSQSRYVDVSGDNVLTPNDALLVINFINEQLVRGLQAEGESNDNEQHSVFGSHRMPMQQEPCHGLEAYGSPVATTNNSSRLSIVDEAFHECSVAWLLTPDVENLDSDWDVIITDDENDLDLEGVLDGIAADVLAVLN